MIVFKHGTRVMGCPAKGLLQGDGWKMQTKKLLRKGGVRCHTARETRCEIGSILVGLSQGPRPERKTG